jgi:hypothetical protein
VRNYNDEDDIDIEYDELGFPKLKPYYIDKYNDVTLDRILGIDTS